MKPPRMKRGHGSNTTFQSPSGASSFPNTDWVRLSVFLRDSRAALMSRVHSFYAPLMCESLRTRSNYYLVVTTLNDVPRQVNSLLSPESEASSNPWQFRA